MAKTKKTAVSRKKTVRGGAKKRNSVKASVLAVTLFVIGIGVAIGLSSVLLSIRERKSSIGEGSSSRAFQNAESGVETVQKAIKEVMESDPLSEIGDLSAKLGGAVSCDANGNFVFSGYVIEFQKSDGATKISCSDSTVPLSDVIFVKSSGEAGSNRRMVKATLFCADADISSDLKGYWKFDGNLNDEASSNNANYCLQRTDPAATLPNSDPALKSDGTDKRSNYIRFNEGANRNCVRIDDIADYRISEGTVSFWLSFHSRPTGPITSPLGSAVNSAFVFSKDAYECDIRTDSSKTVDIPSDSSCRAWNSSNNDSDCDCGHLSFFGNWGGSSNNFGLRFQNDGNGAFQSLSNNQALPSYSFNDANWRNQWHLITLTFSPQEIILYIDGKEHDKKKSASATDNPDGIFEGLANNDWDIYLGASYPGFYPQDLTINPIDGNPVSGIPFPGYMVWARADMDDLRIYSRALNQCDVTKLYNDTK